MAETVSHQFEDGSTGGPPAPEDTPSETSERPEWLPEKFENPEAMAKAYSELERKLSSPPSDPPKTEESKPEPKAPADDTLNDADRELLRQLRESQTNSFVEEVLGNPEEVLTWAEKGLTEDLQQAWDEAIASGNRALIRLAGQGLRAAYVDANGSEPNLVKGGQPVPSRTGAKPFRSNDEVVKAMSDPRYRTDPAYQAEVYRRLQASS